MLKARARLSMCMSFTAARTRLCASFQIPSHFILHFPSWLLRQCSSPTLEEEPTQARPLKDAEEKQVTVN